MKPLVSVMMPAWNASCFITAAIRSMQAQTYQNWQLCIVDDGSDDTTYEIATTFIGDPRICIDEIDHAGCPGARNHCLKMAQGDIIARLDADDTHHPDRLERQVDYLLSHSDVDIVSCGMTWIKGGIMLPRPGVKGMDPRTYMAGTSNGPCNASIVAWTRVYDIVGGYDLEMLAGSDGDWNFRAIIENMKWGFIDETWYNQRRHPAQISQSMRPMQRKVHYESREKYSKLWNPNG